MAYYCPEPGSDSAQRFLVENPGASISWLTGVELMSALSRKVRERGIERRDAARIAALYGEHVAHGCYRLLPVEAEDFERAVAAIAQFDNALRALDALHLAIVQRQSLDLVTADRDLAEAAKGLAIKVTFLSKASR